MFLKFFESSESKANLTPHYRPGNFMEPERVAVYNTLSEVIDSDNEVFVKVCLAELVTKPKSSQQNLKHWRRVQRRRLDFLICSASALEPILAIKVETELDSKLRRKLGPDVVDEVLDDIGLPLLRINAEDARHAEYLTHKIQFAKEEYRQKIPNSALEPKTQQASTTIVSQFIAIAKSLVSNFWAVVRTAFHRLVLRATNETSK
jgi:hypothetical protein